LAQLLFVVGTPVFAVELKEDRGVGHGHVGFEDEDVEVLAGFTDLGDELFVRKRLDGSTLQRLLQAVAVGVEAGKVLLRDVGQLGVEVDVGGDVNGAVERGEDGGDDGELIGASLDDFDSGRDLERVGGVDDEYPVAVAKEQELLRELCMPVGSGNLRCSVGAERSCRCE